MLLKIYLVSVVVSIFFWVLFVARLVTCVRRHPEDADLFRIPTREGLIIVCKEFFFQSLLIIIIPIFNLLLSCYVGVFLNMEKEYQKAVTKKLEERKEWEEGVAGMIRRMEERRQAD